MKVKHLAICIAISSFTLHLSAAVNPKNGGANHKSTTAAPVVEGWYFRAVSGYPAAIGFEPVVLFKNGEYFDIGDEPLETLDVAASKSSRPKAWGTWKKNGATFLLINNEGKSHDYKLGAGNWFPAYAYTGAVKLKKGYEKVSGGDYGNGTNALVIKKISFIDDTHFAEGSNGGVMTPGATAWKKTGFKGGTYKVYGNTIELNYGSKVIKKSFAFGATGSPAHPTNTMIFIGGDAYTDTE
ncbi:hypothetical protein [Mucilaginibacter kameinonensis]|uniref:hypothetical protein n=1 Tax=Mucilaginibacter kameinonensis TaxID=452286 RepID=UPI000EF84546|nr:hypothetical protein [Mucilaginibacter kameinonensis]